MTTVSINETAAQNPIPADRNGLLRSTFNNATAFLKQRPEVVVFVVLIFVFNLPVLFGGRWTAMVFQPEAVMCGEWWRLVTHPFVHLTWYHLLLDGTAFLSLYCSLFERRIGVRLLCVLAAGAGSLAAAWLASPTLMANGLCGLSGVAHGLTAISAVEMIGGDKDERKVGWITFCLVLVKAAFEAVTGKMFFGFLDFGMLGNPVAVSHAGGVLGGLIVALFRRRPRGERPAKGGLRFAQVALNL